jgi:hypothetical protein
MGYSLSIKLTKKSQTFCDKLNSINWDKLNYPENPAFCFQGTSTAYGPENSFGFDYSNLGTEQRVALYNFVQKLSVECGQKGFYYYDDERINDKLSIKTCWLGGFHNDDLYDRWVKFFENL